ncbi:hypothetical protein ACTXT7_004380 [Hymenolepis weldensis]
MATDASKDGTLSSLRIKTACPYLRIHFTPQAFFIFGRPFFLSMTTMEDIKTQQIADKMIGFPMQIDRNILSRKPLCRHSFGNQVNRVQKFHSGHPGVRQMKSIPGKFAFKMDMDIKALVQRCFKYLKAARLPPHRKPSPWPKTAIP